MNMTKRIFSMIVAASILLTCASALAKEKGAGLPGGLKQGMVNGAKNGMANGLSDGAKNGMANGLPDGAKNGMANGLPEGLKKGMVNGLVNGTLDGLLAEGIITQEQYDALQAAELDLMELKESELFTQEQLAQISAVIEDSMEIQP